MAQHHELDCHVKRLDCSVVVNVKVTEKVQNSSDCSSGQHLLSCLSFCNQTWYGDASSWTRVSCKKIGSLCSRSRSQWGIIKSNMTVSIITELLIFLQPSLIGWCIIISWSVLFWKKTHCCCQDQDHSEGSKLYWIFMCLISSVPLISWQPKKLCLFTVHSNQTKYNKVGIYFNLHCH